MRATDDSIKYATMLSCASRPGRAAGSRVERGGVAALGEETAMTGQYEGPMRPAASDIASYLLDGVSVQLMGLPGSGRSELARRVADELTDRGFETLWVKGIAPLRDRSLAALALAGVAIEPVPASVSNTMVVAKTADALGKVLGRKKNALIIDDAEYLDPSSGGVILAAHGRRSFPILFVDRPGRDADDLISMLVAESQPGVRIAMGVLSFEDIHRLVHEVLPGTVEPATVARVAIMSGGLPRLVLAIVDAARRSGRIRLVNDVWCLAGELWDERLVQVVHPLLRGLSPDDVSTLAAIVYAADTPQAAEVVLAGEAGAALRLREAGLLRFSGRTAGSLVSVFPPLLSEYLLRHGPVDLQGSEPDEWRPEPEITTWRDRLPMGVDASEYAAHLVSHWRTQMTLRQRAWEQQCDAAHAAPLLAAMHAASASPAEVAAVLERTPLDGDDQAASAIVAGWSAVYRSIAQDDTAGAVQDLRDQYGRWPACDGYLRATGTHLGFLDGHPPTPSDLLPAGGLELPLSQEAVAGTAAEALIAAGRTTEAFDYLAELDPHDPIFAGHWRVCEGLARVFGSDVAGGVDWALNHLVDAVDALEPGLIDGHAYAAAAGMTLLGALDDLDDLVDIMFRLPGTTTLQRHYRAGLFSLAAVAKGWEGHTEQARRLAAQAAALSKRVGPYPAMFPSIETFLGPRPDPDVMWNTVDERLAGGYVVVAAVAAVPAVEHGADPARAKRMIEVGTASQSAVVRALSGYVAAVVARDPELLRHSIDELRCTCGPLYAMRAGVSRAVLLRELDEIDAAGVQADAAWREGGLGARCRGLFVRLNAAIDLTPREREVIPLVAQGLTSTTISSEVDVTRRTVETHILGAYRKIGVRTRRELCDALATWLVV